jgi:hypothetical protein
MAKAFKPGFSFGWNYHQIIMLTRITPHDNFERRLQLFLLCQRPTRFQENQAVPVSSPLALSHRMRAVVDYEVLVDCNDEAFSPDSFVYNTGIFFSVYSEINRPIHVRLRAKYMPRLLLHSSKKTLFLA